MRVVAQCEPDLFLKIYSLGRERYETDRHSYHVSARLELLPKTGDLPSLLDDFHAREILHVTFGSTLAQFGAELQEALLKNETAYLEGVQSHLEKHLQLLQTPL